MKRISCLIIGWMLAVFSVNGQDCELLDEFMSKYGQNWQIGYWKNIGGKDVFVKQLGRESPDYHFSRRLNSKTLKGKFVLMNFWSTWCSGCRELSCEIDSIMKQEPDVYEGVQVIGVNAHESMIENGVNAERWWSEQGIAYPTVGGKPADKFCDSVHGGHPSVILINREGVICGRWDAWSPSVAEEINTAIWALNVLPQQVNVKNLEIVKTYMRQKKYYKALYLLSLWPETPNDIVLRYECMLGCGSENMATEYFDKLREKYEVGRQKVSNPWEWRPTEDYVTILRQIGECIYRVNTTNVAVLRNGVEAMTMCVNSNHRQGYADYELAGILRVRYATACKVSGLGLIETAIEHAKQAGVDEEEILRLKKIYSDYYY